MYLRMVSIGCILAALTVGLVAAGDAPGDQDSNDAAVDSIDITHTIDGTTVTVEGVYMAPDAGYSVTREEIMQQGDTLVATIEIERTGDMAAQVVTPVNFAATATPEAGTYDIEKTVIVDGDTRLEQRVPDAVEITDPAENGGGGDEPATRKGLLARIRAWFSSLF